MKKTAFIIVLAAIVPSEVATSGSPSRAEAFKRLEQSWRGGVQDDLPNKCGLPVLGYAATHQAELSALGVSVSALLTRPATQKSILRGSFRIHYDTTGANEAALLNAQRQRIPNSADQFADSVGAIANYCLRFERDSLGYLPPPPDRGAGGGDEIDIYIQELGNTYGLTTPEISINGKADGGTFTNFITIDNDFIFVRPDSNKGLPGLRVTVAHELHHAIQLGNYGYWTSDIYFYEITSTWMEDAVFTEINDYLQYVQSRSNGHFVLPGISFMSNAFVMYSRGIWGHFVAKRFGRDAMRKCWEEIRNHRPQLAINAALSNNYGVSLRNAFAEWAIWNRYTAARSDSILYYPEGRNYPSIMTEAVDFTSSSRSYSKTVQPFAARYHDIDTRVEKFPIVNLNFDAARDAPTSDFTYVLQLSTTKTDDSYAHIGDRIFAKLSVPDPQNWFAPLAGGSSSPFPNPLHADGLQVVSIPAVSTASGMLSIYSVSMDLIYSAVAFPKTVNGLNVFQWNGKDNEGNVAASGIYIYVVESGNEKIVGKIAVIRK